MILIADSGSTKTDWILINTNKDVVGKTETKGLNPSVFSESDLYKTITSNTEVMSFVNDINRCFYMGQVVVQRPQKKSYIVFLQRFLHLQRCL